ncbi:MAG: sigma-54-dependent Fis family transcriptional regulator [Deltaproteobacteria bacterium]|nr:sigma-54-dependent Fis family transcriptional regulator [Deltaproteobacteria bacterium]
MESTLYPAAPILHVDDEQAWLTCLGLALERSGAISHILSCNDSREVMKILASQAISVVLLDLNMPYVSGEELLIEIQKSFPEIPVIILTGHNQIETAVKCMKLGAYDFFVKTTEEERLIGGVKRALKMRALETENRQLKNQVEGKGLKNPGAFSGLITQNSQMLALFHYVEAISNSSEPVLIIGESGTGKEMIAQAVHATSRPKLPWVAVNVAGLDDNVFSDTLFGHVKGAFTGAAQNRQGMIDRAGEGTLFLDEIGDLSHQSQVKLLRLLQEKEYYPLGSDRPQKTNARIVAATNKNLALLQSEGSFREDLFYRLKAHQLLLPPLRQRIDDIPFLLDRMLEEAARELDKKKPTPPKELEILLSTYGFPGNIRELRAMVFDAVSIHQTGKLSMNSFRKAIEANREIKELNPGSRHQETSFPRLKEMVDLHVAEALRQAQGNQSIAAELLGISGAALSKRLKKTPELKAQSPTDYS